MAYEQASPYTRIFDATQSPAYLDTIASRFGGQAPRGCNGTRRVYLDLGCAQGQTILGLAPLYPDVDFIGIDFNAQHVVEAGEESSRLGLTNTRFIEADFRSLPSDLPAADYLVVRGVYSWLAPDAKTALEAACGRLAAPGALLKLHFTVPPGALMRENLIRLMRTALGPAPTPDAGRAFIRALLQDAGPYTALFGDGKRVLEAMLLEGDEAWRHDLFNEDYAAEPAHTVIERLTDAGFRFLASTYLGRNVPAVQVSERIALAAQALPLSRGQTLLDHAMGIGARDDLLQREPSERRSPTYDTSARYGLIVPQARLAQPFQTAIGEVHFTRDDCRQIIAQLTVRPMTWAELRDRLPAISADQLGFWLDMLLAAARVGPFLSSEAAGTTDRVRLRRLNRERIAHAVANLTAQTRTPLLAAEYGNCLVAGWFETLVLWQLEERDTPDGQAQMLRAMQAAGLAFPGDGRRPAHDQSAALRREVSQLEANYLCRMDYWGIEV